MINNAKRSKSKKPYAVTHTHGAYDANESNIKNRFSSPGDVASGDDKNSDIYQSNRSGYDYYLVSPNGELKKYTSNSEDYEGDLIRTDMIVDTRIEIHKQMKKTLLWNLLFINFPNCKQQNYVNARRDNPDSLLNTIRDLEKLR